MFNKTTSFIFNRYGEIISDLSKRQTSKMINSVIKLKDKNITNYYSFNCDVFVKVLSGIVMLVVSLDENAAEYEKFVIHRVIKIKAGVKFNFISISANSKIDLIQEFSAKKVVVPTFQKVPVHYERLVPSLSINEIYGYYYQVRNANYVFPGEKHDFWELSFIDNGILDSTIDDQNFQLKNFDLILYAPGQYHTQSTKEHQSCSYLTILFDMDIKEPERIINRVFTANRDIHNALNDFIKVSSNETFYDSELMLCYLKELIVKLLQFDFLSLTPIASTPMQQRFENELLNEVLLYINENIYESLTIEEICHKFSISRSSLQTLFKNNLNIAPKQYISDLKLNKSKLLIKESLYTISEISSKLGFTSIHYFSRKFKQQFGITPSDYAKTIYN
ncbi:MAG: AraC family transcriptional regulator [Erysipelotrichaceae bacterium]